MITTWKNCFTCSPRAVGVPEDGFDDADWSIADFDPLFAQRGHTKTGAWIENVRKSPSDRSGSGFWAAGLCLGRYCEEADEGHGKLDLQLNRRSF